MLNEELEKIFQYKSIDQTFNSKLKGNYRSHRLVSDLMYLYFKCSLALSLWPVMFVAYHSRTNVTTHPETIQAPSHWFTDLYTLCNDYDMNLLWEFKTDYLIFTGQPWKAVSVGHRTMPAFPDGRGLVAFIVFLLLTSGKNRLYYFSSATSTSTSNLCLVVKIWYYTNS